MRCLAIYMTKRKSHAFEESTPGSLLRETLMQQLQTSNRFVVVTNRDDADAVFKGSVGQASPRRVNSSAVLELVNAGGEVVWSSAVVKGKQDDPAEASAEIVRVLLRDTRRLERRR